MYILNILIIETNLESVDIKLHRVHEVICTFKNMLPNEEKENKQESIMN